MSIDHGKLLTEIEHEITAMATKVDVTVRLCRASNIMAKVRASNIMAKVRALAQPAEAVEVFNCLDCPVSVESPWVAPRCPECGGPTELDTAAIPSRRPAEVAKDAEGINWQAWAESFGVSFSGKVGGMLAATYRTAKRDAAQGAVAPFGYWLTDCNGIGRFALGDSNQSALVSYRMTPGYAATPLYTHPQAAPAQGGES